MKARLVFLNSNLYSCLFGLGLLLLPMGQATDGIALTINQVDDSAYPQVEVFVSVSDPEGVPIEGLGSEDFQLFQEGNSVDDFEVSAVDDTGLGVSVILVVDTSGSMANQNAAGVSRLDLAREAISVLVDSLDETRDQVALFDFNSEVELRQPFSSDMAGLTMALNELTTGQNTRLNDAAYEAAVLAATLPPGRKAIVFLTDGQDTESRLTLEDAIAKAQESGVPFYTVGLEAEVDSNPLERLALLTGGRYLASAKAENLEAQFAIIASQLRQQYVLTFEADVPADGHRHELSLRATYHGITDEDARSFIAHPRPGSVTIAAPETGQTVAGSTIISPTFEMPGQVAQVVLSIDGQPQETRINPPFTFDWDSSTVGNGSHILGLTVRDHVGNQAETSSTVVVVPLVEATLISPVEDQEIGSEIALEVVVDSSFLGVERVEFSVNGLIVDTLRTPPYETVWDTADLEPGHSIISATVYDSQGHQKKLVSEITLIAPSPTPQPTATAIMTRPASRPQQEVQTDGSGSLSKVFSSPILFIGLGIVILGMFGVLIAFVLWRRGRSSQQSPEKSYHTEIDEFERRVIEQAKAQGKARPDSYPPVETRAASSAENITLAPTHPIDLEFIPDEFSVTQMLPHLPAIESAATRKVKEQAYFLVTHAGKSKADWYPLRENEIIVGRAKDSDIRLVDVAVSRHHATVRYENGNYFYKDLEPTNPSVINGAIYNKPVLVKDGDEIVVGETKLVFKNSI